MAGDSNLLRGDSGFAVVDGVGINSEFVIAGDAGAVGEVRRIKFQLAGTRVFDRGSVGVLQLTGGDRKIIGIGLNNAAVIGERATQVDGAIRSPGSRDITGVS